MENANNAAPDTPVTDTTVTDNAAPVQDGVGGQVQEGQNNQGIDNTPKTTPDVQNLTDLTAGEGEQNPDQKQADTIPEIYELVSKTGQPAEDAKDFQEIFKKAGLTAKQAQAMYDAYNLKSNDIAEQFKQAVAQKVEADMQAVRADPELGGANFNNTKMFIGKAMDTFGTPELREKLKTAGFGNDPDFVRFVARVGKAFSNDQFIGGHGNNSRQDAHISAAKALYSKSPELWH